MSVAIDEIRRMTVAERMELLDDIWETLLEEEEAIPTTEAQRQELDRRLAEYRANPAIAVP